MNGVNLPITPCQIVQDNWSFSIPIYQRLFVWESEQIERLLEDLWLASQTETQNNNATQPYYIGVITTVEQINGDIGRVFSVVDGQQRLTFLLLFFSDCLARYINIEEAQNFVFVNNGQNTSHLRISFLGRDDDEQDILNYVNHDTASIKNVNFQKFHTCMDVFIKNHNTWDNQKDQFIKYVFKKTSFLVNELVGYSNADLNLYFEKMNSTGRQLSPLDQLKGSFAEHAPDWNDCFNFETTRVHAREERDKTGSDSPVDIDLQQDFLNEIVKWKRDVEKEPAPSKESRAYSRLPMHPEVLALHVLQLTLNGTTVNLSPRHLLDSTSVP